MSRPRSKVALAVALVALVAHGVPAGAQSFAIPIVNPGFEEGPLADGQFRNFAFGWTRGGTGTAGVLNPPPGAYPPTGAALEGQNVAFLSGTASFTQTLSAVLEANTGYDLAVAVGHRADVIGNSWFFELLAGGTHLIGDSSGPSVPPPGTFHGRGATLFPLDPSDPRVGQPLTIRLSTVGGGQTNFDRVSLTATPFPLGGGVTATLVNPEPGTIALLATGLLAIGGSAVLRRRRPRR